LFTISTYKEKREKEGNADCEEEEEFM